MSPSSTQVSAKQAQNTGIFAVVGGSASHIASDRDRLVCLRPTEFQPTYRLSRNWVAAPCVRRYPVDVKMSHALHSRSRNTTVGVATGYGLDGRGVGLWVPVGTRFVSSLRRPDRFGGPPSLLSIGCLWLFPRG
jgi:hypothetical protein